MIQQVRNSADALRALQANISPRYRRLDTIERYVDCTQYEGRASWFDDSVPLFDRAPCFVYPIAESAISSHVALTLGGHRFPAVTTGSDEDDSEEKDDFGLSEDDSNAVDKLIRGASKQSRLDTVCRELLASAMSCGTAVAVPSIRNGKMYVESVPAKCCEVSFLDGADGVVERLEYRFPYLKEERNSRGEIEEKCYLFRRVIDSASDVTYKAAEANERGIDPLWQPDSKRTIQHGLGFCPVVWYRFKPKHTDVSTPDGVAIHAHLLDEITALDFALSQLHRATITCTDPILVEIGVEAGYSPTGIVQGSILFSGERATSMLNDPKSMTQWRMGGGGTTGRKRGPGTAYQYPNKDAKVELLTLPEGSMKAASENAANIEQKICRALRWTQIDPKEIRSGAALSGRALEMLRGPQAEFCDEVRGEFGPNCIVKIVDMMLRMIVTAGDGVYLSGLKRAMPILQRFVRVQRQRDGGVTSVWMPPDIRCIWPPYFKPNDVDQKAAGDNVRADVQAKLITRATAVKQIAPFYEIEDPAQYAEDLDAEDAKETEALHKANRILGDDSRPGEPSGTVDVGSESAPVEPPAPGAAVTQAGA
jgi:hypothetical protein